MSTELKLFGKTYEIVDAIEYITLADSFVKNKLGSGHGEAKLYVGNESEKLLAFFDDFDKVNCFFCKKDFASFLADAETEFKSPQQQYIKKKEMPQRYEEYKERLSRYSKDILPFQLYKVTVAPPRVYVNSNSDHYDYMRTIGLPNISYLSVLKLVGSDEKTYYYFKIFVDYKSGIIGYTMLEEEKQTAEIEEKNISKRKKETLIQARIGQGDYRNKLLEECPFCPFTMVNDERLLIASHIKPWAKADDNEKVDPKNGYMLTPTFDRLFDRGFITFKEDKSILVSPWLSPMNQKRLGIYTGKIISNLPMDTKRIEYLKFHKENIFKE